jgi:hypothetical protein
VTNPIFEAAGAWDLIFDISGARVVVHKDIHMNVPATSTSSLPPMLRAGAFQGQAPINGEDDREKKSDYVGKADNPDNMFMEDASLFSFVVQFPAEGLFV